MIHLYRFLMFGVISMLISTGIDYFPEFIELLKTNKVVFNACVAVGFSTITTLGYALYENWESKENDNNIRSGG